MSDPTQFSDRSKPIPKKSGGNRFVGDFAGRCVTRQGGSVGRVARLLPHVGADRERDPKLGLSSKVADGRRNEHGQNRGRAEVIDGDPLSEGSAVFLGNFAFPSIILVPANGTCVVLCVQDVECIHAKFSRV